MAAQVDYAEILDMIQPLRDEVAGLEAAADELKKKQSELEQTIADLEKSINQYKDEYAVLISETQDIKNEMGRVKAKVERSIALLQNLNSERGRWERESETFQAHMSTVVGDALLSAAFLTYSGFFDQHYRTSLMDKWMSRLTVLGVKFKSDLSPIEYLSHPDARLAWQANALPADDLAIENAIMLERFNRYPLVIDPSGQATQFLMNQFKDKKITKVPVCRCPLASCFLFNSYIVDKFLRCCIHEEPGKCSSFRNTTLGGRRRKHRSSPQSSLEQRNQKDWRASAHSFGRSGRGFLALVCDLPGDPRSHRSFHSRSL